MTQQSLSPLGRRILIVMLIAGTLGGLFFAGRTITKVVYWADPAHQQQALEPWMTIGYVAKSYRLDPKDLGQSLGLKREPGRPKPLRSLARERGVSFEEFSRDIEQAIAKLEPQG